MEATYLTVTSRRAGARPWLVVEADCMRAMSPAAEKVDMVVLRGSSPLRTRTVRKGTLVKGFDLIIDCSGW